MTDEIAAGKYAVDPGYKENILKLYRHHEPGYPSFVQLKLQPVNLPGEAVESTLWHVGKTQLPGGQLVNRYHVHSQQGGKILPAFFDDKRMLLYVATQPDKIDKA